MGKYIAAIILILMMNSAAYSGVVYYDDPLAVGIGARPVGMGRAFVAIADDGNAIFMNPAGLGSQNLWNLSSMSTNFMDEYRYTMLSAVYPTPGGVYGLGYVSSSINDIILSDGGTANFYNYALVLSYGRPIGKLLEPYLGGDHQIYGGANLKYYSKGFSGDLQASGAGINIDTGLKWKYNERWSFGLNFQNILVGSKVAGDFDPEDMPSVTKIGAAYYFYEYNVKLSLDKDMFFGRSVPWPMHFGVEWKAHPLLTLRGGFDQVAGASGGGDIATNATFGVGLEYKGVSIDLAYMQNFAETNISSTFLSLTFSGGPLFAEEKKITKEAAPPTPAKAPEVMKAPAKPITEKILLMEPQDKTYTFDSETTFWGKVDPDVAELWINTKQVPFNSEGNFAQVMQLEYDKNNFDIRIRDAAGNEGSVSMSIARYYLPKDMTKEQATSRTVDYVIIQSKVHDYLGKDYSPNDYISREALNAILEKIKQAQKSKGE